MVFVKSTSRGLFIQSRTRNLLLGCDMGTVTYNGDRSWITDFHSWLRP
jgi:hypothetical protein